MKKISTLLLAAAGLTLASCSQDDLSGVVSNGDGNYTVQITIPKTMATRAVDEFGTGLQALVLKGAVYDNGSYVQPFTADFPAGQLSTTVDFNLVKNKSYKIAFFAQSQTSIEDGVYTFNAETSTITVTYENMKSESNLNDAYDCFLGVLETGVIGTNEVKASIILDRPVAQVNWGTNDLFTTDENGNQIPTNAAHEKAYGENGQFIMTNLTVSKPYNSINFLTNEMTQANGDVDIDAMAAPYNFPFPLNPATSGQNPDDYIYVAMTYLLAPAANSAVYDLNLNIDNSGEATDGSTAFDEVNTEVSVSAVPVQANYQTNIYGNLLSDNVQVTVTKNPVWETPDYELPLGNMIAPGLYKDGNTYTIMSPAGLEYYAENIGVAANLNNGLSGITVILGADLDMTGINHTPIYNCSATFDGQDHTISNLSVTQSNGDSAGLFASTIGTVKNLTITDATIVGNYKAGVLGGDAIASNIQNVTILNSTVTSTPWKKNGAWDDGNNVGGLVGYLSAETTGNVENCTVSGCTIIGMRKVGGIVGYANGNCTITGCEISNTSVIADLATNYYGDTTPTSENVVGAIASNGTSGVGTDYNTGNTIGENVTTTIIGPGTQASPVELNTIEDLQDLATLVNSGRAYSGKYFQLQDDIDLSDVDNWTPIGKSGAPFSGNFDGNGKTISNLTSGKANTSYTGFFGYTTNGTVSNLNFENANVQGYLYVGVVAGDPYTTKYSDINISGLIQVEGFSYVGGAVGYNSYGALTNIVIEASEGSYVKANSVQGSTAYRTYVGGIVGFPGEGGKVYSGLKSNIDVYGSTMGIGGISGLAHYGLTFENCECSGNVYITNATSQLGLNEVGGIAGCWHNNDNTTVTFTDCTFTGHLYSTGSLQPSIGDEKWNELNAITGGAYSATGTGILYINGQDVTSQHGYYFPTN